MISIRTRLVLILIAGTTAIWLSGLLWIQHETKARIEHALDARLAEAARMVASLEADHDAAPRTAAGSRPKTGDDAFHGAAIYSRQLSCQIWKIDGSLVAKSEGAPPKELAAAKAGFSDNTIDGEAWRVFVVSDPERGFRVMVGDRMRVRNRLVRGVTRALIVPAVLLLPILAALIWISVGRALGPLNRLATALERRGADDLVPLPEAPAPRELRPVTVALNGLIRRVSAARDRERSFTAYAAHELKTPLAGLKTQAQVAALAPDDATRRQALARLQEGVDRTGRLVKQLLDLARLDSAQDAVQHVPCRLDRLVAEVADGLAQRAEARGVTLVRDVGPVEVATDPLLLALGLRNLIENAIQASPRGAKVRIRAEKNDAAFHVAVQDRGKGIPEAERDRVVQRFYRGAGNADPGSGLGLPIVTLVADLLGGRLEMRSRSGGGESCTLVVPLEPAAARS